MADYIVAVFGAGGVGKSCLTRRFVQDVFPEKYDPTIEDIYRKTIEVDEQNYSLEIVDTAGTDEFSSMRDLYIQDAHGYLLVYSITSGATFSDIQGYYERITAVKDIATYGQPALVLVGNKCDLEDSRQVTRESGQALARTWNCAFFETSAKYRTNVTDIFCDLVRQISTAKQPKRNNQLKSTLMDDSDVQIEFRQLTTSNETKKTGCCVFL